uniref:Galectin domain-containing protein n=1 Tax=Macrostomum lignano TaxID=282301 RepID=A0A1I8GH24_9PLAT
LSKQGTQFTYDIPDGLIEGDCVEVKGRLTGKRVCLELSGALTKVPSTAAADGDAEKVEEHRVVPLRLRFSRGGRYKLHSDYLGREASRRGRFRYDFQADSQFIVQIRILHLYYDIRINDIELIKLEHGQLHNEIQMLSLDGDAEFTAVDFIDLEDLAEATGGGLAISLPMGDPIDNSSPASEPELIVPKKFRKQNAQQPVLDTIDTAGTMDYADGRAAHQQQRTKRRTEEPTSEMPAGVKARKTKLPSSSSKENDAHPELTVDSAEQRLELKDSSTSEARRSRDRRPKGLANNDKLMVAELPIQSDKQPKQSTGEPRRSKRTSDQQQTLQQGNKAELGFDIKDSESKQERSQRKKTTKSPRTSSKASNYSTSEVADLGPQKLDSPKTGTDPHHQKEHSAPPGSDPVDTKPNRQKLDTSKAQKQQIPAGSYSVPTPTLQQQQQRRPQGQSSLGRPRRGSGAGEAEVLPPSAPSQQQQQQKQPHNVQSSPPVKSALPKAPNKQRLGESRADTAIQSQDAPAPGSYSSPRAQQQKLKRADVEPQHELEISGSYNIEAQQSAVKQKSHQQRLVDGVYRVVPVTPVVSALPVANQQQQQQILLKQKQLKQQSQQRQESAGEMSDSLWKSQHIDEDNLVSLTDSQLDSADCPSAAADQDVAPKSNRSSSRKSSSGLSSVAEANADAAGPCNAVKRLDISGPWSIQERRKVPPSNDTFDEDGSSQTAADQAFRHSATPSELLYAESKVYDTITVESEPEPFVAHLPEPLRSGRRIIVSGQFSESTKRATLSLRNSKRSGISASTDNAKTRKAAADVEEEFLVQLKQLDEEGGATELTCRQYNGREWTSEQRSMTRALKPNKTGSFCVEIHTSSVAFTVRFEDAVCVQPHTIPFSNFTHLVLDGSSEYQSIEFPDELELPYSEEFPQSLDLVSHILIKLQLLKSAGATSGKRASTTVPGSQSPIAFGLDHGAAMLCLMDPVKQTVSVGRTVPETGGFLCETKVDRVPDLAKLSSVLLRMETDSVLILLDGKPVLSYNLLTRKHYITSFFIDGNFLLKDVVWKEKRAPKWTPLPPSFQVGRSIRVSGLLPEDGRSVCCVALTVDAAGAPESSNAAFCLRCEPGRQPSVTSSAPSASSATMQRPPLLPGQRFEAHILCKLTGFEVMLGDLEAGVCQVPHGVDPRQLRSVRLTGGAVFYEVDFPDQLGLPYLNRFPVSLKESRFVTVDVECGLHASRPNTISFALCTGPGDACLKPLVCEFNMAQGYASMAWSNPAGELCDEDTKKFDPRLAGEVETVALQATDSDYILSVNETAVLKYPVRHSLDEIQYVLIDGDVCITSVQFEGKAATPSCCIN